MTRFRGRWVTRGGHVAMLYPSGDESVRGAVEFLRRALLMDGSAIAIATRPHLRAIERGLVAAGVDLHGLRRRGNLLELDAEMVAAELVSAGSVRHERFEQFADEVLERASRCGGPVHLYGEIVAALWDAGQVTAAIELEHCWNALGHRWTFALLCGYPTDALRTEDGADAFRAVSELHRAVLAAPETGAAVPGDGLHRATFAKQVDQVARARRFVMASLPSADEELRADAALVVTELAANAVMHARSEFTVTVGLDHRALYVAVEDRAPATPGFTLEPAPGRGLGLVAALSEHWGYEERRGGKVVWAAIPAPADARAEDAGASAQR